VLTATRVCPFWIGYLLISPVRTFLQNAEKILNPYITSGMRVLDIGCGMGFFSLPMAGMVGSTGKVLCIDIQKKMIHSLEKRAKKAGLSDRIETHVCPQNSLGLQDLHEDVDFALAFAVIHEVPRVHQFFSEVNKALKPSGILLIAEPKGHVSKKTFDTTIAVAQQYGFKGVSAPKIWRSRTILLRKGAIIG